MGGAGFRCKRIIHGSMDHLSAVSSTASQKLSAVVTLSCWRDSVYCCARGGAITHSLLHPATTAGPFWCLRLKQNDSHDSASCRWW